LKSAAIIGASAGLGRYLAERLANDGWAVFGIGRRPLDPSGVRFEYQQLDLSSLSDLEVLRGRLDALEPELVVCSAVVYGAEARAAGGEAEIDDLERLFRINALAPYNLMLHYLGNDTEAKHRSCVMVNVDSIYHASRQTGVYAASKAALRVLTTALAHNCKSRNASVSTLLLGPLADEKKLNEFRAIAVRKGLSEQDVIHVFLERPNPAFVMDTLIDLEPCYRSIMHMASIGRTGNGMMCRIDGGLAGSLI